jgi:hypothetical protein
MNDGICLHCSAGRRIRETDRPGPIHRPIRPTDLNRGSIVHERLPVSEEGVAREGSSSVRVVGLLLLLLLLAPSPVAVLENRPRPAQRPGKLWEAFHRADDGLMKQQLRHTDEGGRGATTGDDDDDRPQQKKPQNQLRVFRGAHTGIVGW